MESNVTINIAREGKHFFRVVVDDGAPTPWEEVYRTLRSRFQPPLYRLDITRWMASGTNLPPPPYA